ncbi:MULTISPECIES: HupE/UreJ family protein [unclassified Polaromonas]|uniref:HupE/UreJ family protein n=1 Tax=unclassified Polaromonas TaxID=2638319 RepID=UPI000F0791E9|nr:MULTISPECIES: HupE/UreJ family protein [unclassified Polaromonas]AYQ26879.1 urease accessory protein UreJ [Polaromonas sp. SP1]QGJ18274.1 urease accessory protein UreJ [Polaromonas sp. Pch-P]
MQAKTRPALFLIAICAIPTLASAHIGHEAGEAAHSHARAFMGGFLHPLTGLDHLAAMVAVGLWSVLAARRAWPDLLWAPLGFAAMLLAGALLGLQGVQLPAVEPMIAASLLVLGLLVLTRWRVPGIAAAALVGVFAVFHGLAHGYELAGDANALPVVAGMLAATFLLHISGMAAGWALRHANVWAPRLAGAGVAVFGVTLLARLA